MTIGIASMFSRSGFVSKKYIMCHVIGNHTIYIMHITAGSTSHASLNYSAFFECM